MRVTVDKDFWLEVADLMESGEYVKAFEQLGYIDGVGRTCLCAEGFVCEALAKRGALKRKVLPNKQIVFYSKDGNEYTTFAPAAINGVRAAMPIPKGISTKKGLPASSYLVCMNDTLGLTLKQMAKVIRHWAEKHMSSSKENSQCLI